MKPMIKAILAIALVVAMIATFIACKNNQGDSNETTASQKETELVIDFNDLFPTTATTAASTVDTTSGDTTAETTAATVGTTAATTAATTADEGGLKNEGANTEPGWGTMSP